MKKSSIIIVLFILIGIALVGCGISAAAPTPVPPTDAPSPTPIQPTDTPSPTSEPLSETADGFEVTFDGNDCTVKGPNELPVGDHTFIFINRNDLTGELWLVNYDDGKTSQDMLDGQSEPGEWYPKPSWAHFDSRITSKWEELEGGFVTTSIWKLDRVGEHTIICYVRSPQKIWFPASFMIIEATSE